MALHSFLAHFWHVHQRTLICISMHRFILVQCLGLRFRICPNLEEHFSGSTKFTHEVCGWLPQTPSGVSRAKKFAEVLRKLGNSPFDAECFLHVFVQFRLRSCLCLHHASWTAGLVSNLMTFDEV